MTSKTNLELVEGIGKEADEAEEVLDLSSFDFSIPDHSGFRFRMANELYNALMESHMNRLSSAANKAINEKECLDRDKKHRAAQQYAAQIMKNHPWARKRMEEMIKEADAKEDEAKK